MLLLFVHMHFSCQLSLYQFCIQATIVNKFIMSPLFIKFALAHHKDAISILYCRQAMGNYYSGDAVGL